MARYGMVIDLRSCVGCQACSAACALENQTPYWSDKWRTRVLDIQKGSLRMARSNLFIIGWFWGSPNCLGLCLPFLYLFFAYGWTYNLKRIGAVSLSRGISNFL